MVEITNEHHSFSSDDLSELNDFYSKLLEKLELKGFTKFKNEFIFFLEKIRKRIPSGKKIADPEILIPIVIYIFLRMKLAPVTPTKYANSNIMPKSELLKHFKNFVKYIPEYLADTVFVVYNCAGEWDRYEQYTAASTNFRDLKKGWI